MPSELIRIVIADDHPLIRKGLCSTLEEDEALKVVGEAGNGEAALSLIRKHRPDVAVLDIDMPKMDGFTVARELGKSTLPTRVVFLTLHASEDMFRAALELGGKGYLLKDSAMMEVGVCVHAVADGQMYVSSSLTTYLLQKPKQQPPPSNPLIRDLTSSECRILKLIAEGLSSKEIGDVLSIHYRTVENHRTNMCRKLGIDGANALLRFALQNRQLL